MVLSLQVQ